MNNNIEKEDFVLIPFRHAKLLLEFYQIKISKINTELEFWQKEKKRTEDILSKIHECDDDNNTNNN